jgi:L-threonylcarbamoyladenylate synthase
LIISIDEASAVLLSGGIVAVPTETVYGLAAIADEEAAVEKVYAAKNRPKDNPLICHFDSVDQVLSYGIQLPPHVIQLMEHFSPGPLSFLLHLPADSPLKAATRGLDTVIVRIPAHKQLLALIKKIGKPLAAPSANRSGGVSPTNAQMVEHELGDTIGGVIDGGSSSVGLESTIIDCREKGKVIILRPGVIGITELSAILQPYMIKVETTQAAQQEVTPGSKYPHYAPETPLSWVEDAASILGESGAAMLITNEQLQQLESRFGDSIHWQAKPIVMGSENHWDEIASALYMKLKELDHLDVKKGYVVKRDWNFSSIGIAIGNRLKKAVQ